MAADGAINLNDYNRTAKLFRWTYDGRPLKVG
jgi:hypothetical protein